MAKNVLADLVLKLSTDSTELKVGLDKAKNSLSQLEKNSKNVGGQVAGAFLKMGGALLSVDLVVKGFQKTMASTGKSADLLAQSLAYVQGGVNQFFKAIASGDFKDFGKRIKEAAESTRDYAKALDEIDERKLGSSLNKALKSGELFRQEQIFRTKIDPNTGLKRSLEERTNALEEYIRIRKEISVEDAAIAKQDLSSYEQVITKQLQNSKLAGGNYRNAQRLVSTLRDYYSNLGKISTVQLTQPNGGTKSIIDTINNYADAIDEADKAIKQYTQNAGPGFDTEVYNKLLKERVFLENQLADALNAENQIKPNEDKRASKVIALQNLIDTAVKGQDILNLLTDDDRKKYIDFLNKWLISETEINAVDADTRKIKEGILKTDLEEDKAEREKIIKLKQENALLAIQDEFKRNMLALEQERDNALSGATSEEEKKLINANYLLKVEKLKQEQLKKTQEAAEAAKDALEKLNKEKLNDQPQKINIAAGNASPNKLRPFITYGQSDYMDLSKERDKQLENIKQSLNAGVLSTQEAADQQYKVWQQYYRDVEALSINERDAKIRNVEQWLNNATMLVDTLSGIQEAAMNKELENAGDNEEKKALIREKYFNKQKAFAIAQAIINGALAITNMLATVPGSVINPATWVGIGLAGAVTAAQVGVIATQQFANGGIVSGPTLATVGEYPGARSNPEVIAPLNKLKDMIGTNAGTVKFVIEQDALVGILKAYDQKQILF